jgi:2-dehydro-3-deoxygluconokinase
MKHKILCFGEIMGRFTPPHLLRLGQNTPGSFDFHFAGAEANVATALSHWGMDTKMVTALPDHHAIADACIRSMQGYGVDISNILRAEQGRLGLYFVEQGINQRSGQVIYDRSHSSFSLTPPDQYPWDSILAGVTHLHITGITPALSRHALESTLELVNMAKQKQVSISLDMNYRESLWTWDDSKTPLSLAKDSFRKLMPQIDLLIANELHARACLDLNIDSEISDPFDITKNSLVCESILEAYPNLSKVALNLRHSTSSQAHEWGATLQDRSTGKTYCAPLENDVFKPYKINHVLDRVGAGDAFSAGLLFGLCQNYEIQDAMNFAAASACLAHSIHGDLNIFTRDEIQNLANSPNSWWLKR